MRAQKPLLGVEMGKEKEFFGKVFALGSSIIKKLICMFTLLSFMKLANITKRPKQRIKHWDHTYISRYISISSYTCIYIYLYSYIQCVQNSPKTEKKTHIKWRICHGFANSWYLTNIFKYLLCVKNSAKSWRFNIKDEVPCLWEAQTPTENTNKKLMLY